MKVLNTFLGHFWGEKTRHIRIFCLDVKIHIFLEYFYGKHLLRFYVVEKINGNLYYTEFWFA